MDTDRVGVHFEEAATRLKSDMSHVALEEVVLVIVGRAPPAAAVRVRGVW